MLDTKPVQDLTSAEVKELLDQRAVVLVDVREPAEYAGERIHGALNFPLSTFDPLALPAGGRRPVVFHCGSGKRSAMAVEQCRKAEVNIGLHLAGGIGAWREAGLLAIRFDPATGAVLDVR